jgi:uncharacterized protein YkwD
VLRIIIGTVFEVLFLKKTFMRLLYGILFLALISCEKTSETAPEPLPIPKLTYQEEMLNYVNDFRVKGGTCGTKVMPPVGKVSLNEKLNEVALAHSKDMDAKNYFSHTNKEGKSPRDRLRAAGYQDFTYGENIYQSSLADSEWTFGAWKASAGHCINIMDPNFKEMGLGNHNSFWTQIFATKK